ncbi:MAG: hypothetical protein ACOWWR_01805 [Eubacteriales bacterium]
MKGQKNDMISFMELLKSTLRFFKKHIYHILFLVSLPFSGYVLVYFYLNEITLESITTIPISIIISFYILFFLSLLISYPLLIYIVSNDPKKNLITLLYELKMKLLKVLFFWVIISIIVFLIFLFLISFFYSSSVLINIVPLFIISTMLKLFIDYIFSIQYIMLKDCSVIDALKCSRSLTKQHWWKVFIYYILIKLGGMLLLQGIFNLIVALLPISTIDYIIIAFIQGLFDLFLYTFITVYYLELNKNRFE